MGYQIGPPPALGTYPTAEESRMLRWSAFEECGVRQVMCVPYTTLEGIQAAAEKQTKLPPKRLLKVGSA